MNIAYDAAHRIFKLDTDHTSYVIAVIDEEGFLCHAYYGDKISDTDVAYLLRTGEHPFVPSRNNRDRSAILDTLPLEYPGNGVGDYRESAIAVRDADGHTAVMPMYDSYRVIDGKPKIPGLPASFAAEGECKTLVITMKDEILHLEVELYYTVFAGSDVITRSVRVKNEAAQPVFLTKVMSAVLDLDDENYEMLSLHGSWARERQIDRCKLTHGRHSVGSVKGESSHQENPFIALVSEQVTQETGKVYGMHFIYSGSFLAQVEKHQFDALRMTMGIHPQDFCWELKEGDIFYAPETVLIYSGTGLGTMTRNLHDFYRTHLIRSPYKNKKRPILINNWEATYFDFNTEKLIAIAKEAKKCGIEMLVMDDGWFGYRNDDNTSLGDWEVNEKKITGGLKHLVDEVNQIGLQFGIWFEPEMISPDSNLYRTHPDWAIQIPGRTACRSRNQYVLDLSRKEVRDYAYECVAKILRSANIAYVKWDMNRQLTDLGSYGLEAERQGELLHRYVLGVYELQERLVTEFPELLLENCSGGGGRFDPGMLYYSPQIWCSDDTDAVERLKIQEGTALVYPLSAMGAHVSDCPNHIVGRVTPFETRGHVALTGTFGYELDITKISAEDREQIPQQVAMYHKYNDLVREGDYYRIASYMENHEYDCYEVVSKDRKEALITYVNVIGRANYHSRRIYVKGLLADGLYQIEGQEGVFHGDTLMRAGINAPGTWGDYQSRLIHIITADK